MSFQLSLIDFKFETHYKSEFNMFCFHSVDLTHDLPFRLLEPNLMPAPARSVWSLSRNRRSTRSEIF